MRVYWVYILASNSRTLYIGVSNDLARRLVEHCEGKVAFTARYRITRLVYAESTFDVMAAITREKQLKSWSRAKKVRLIESTNPHWEKLMSLTADPSRSLP